MLLRCNLCTIKYTHLDAFGDLYNCVTTHSKLNNNSPPRKDVYALISKPVSMLPYIRGVLAPHRADGCPQRWSYGIRVEPQATKGFSFSFLFIIIII